MTESAITTLVRVLRRRKVIAIACALIVPLTALGYSYLQEKEYSASASLLFRDPGYDQSLFGTPFFTPSTDPDREAATNLRLVSLGVVAARTSQRLGGDPDRDEISENVEASSAGQSNVVAVTATAESPRLAARLANTFAQEYIEFRREADRATIQQTLQIIEQQLAELPVTERDGPRGRELERQQGQLELLTSLQTGNAELVQPAEVPTSASSPQTMRNLIVGILVGIMLGLGMAFLVDRFDKRLREIDEIQDIFGRPILAQVPKDRVLGLRDWGGKRLPAVVAETFHMLRANLSYFNFKKQVESVLVASAAPGDGKTTVAWNLAAAAAGARSKVLLLEADLRQPDLAVHLGIRRAPGLSEVLTGVSDFDAAVQHIPVVPASAPASPDHGVDVVTAGQQPPNPRDLIDSEQMRELLSRANEEYDFVVIDTPPTTVVSDAVPLLTQVSGVLVVVRLGKSKRDAAESLREQLTNLDAPTLGVVVNSTGKTVDPYGYGYVEERAEVGEKPADDDGDADDEEHEEQEQDEHVAAADGAKPETPAEVKPSNGSRARPTPNWIYNRLVVTGESDALGEFVERAEGDVDPGTGEPVPLDFERHVANPSELVAAQGAGEAESARTPASDDGWWTWNAMWPEREGELGDGSVVYLFASAWSPPREWLEQVSEAHPDLEFALEFVEEFCHAAGGHRWKAGEMVDTWDVDPDTADWVEFDDQTDAD